MRKHKGKTTKVQKNKKFCDRQKRFTFKNRINQKRTAQNTFIFIVDIRVFHGNAHAMVSSGNKKKTMRSYYNN